METIKYSLIVITFSCMSLITTLRTNYVTLKGSSLQGSLIVDNAIIGKLDPTTLLTLTIVTGSSSNTQLVASYYRAVKGIRVFDETDSSQKSLKLLLFTMNATRMMRKIKFAMP